MIEPWFFRIIQQAWVRGMLVHLRMNICLMKPKVKMNLKNFCSAFHSVMQKKRDEHPVHTACVPSLSVGAPTSPPPS